MNLPESVGLAAAVTAGAPLAVIAWVRGVELGLGILPARLRRGLRPWLWVSPILSIVGIILLWPMARTIVLSLKTSEHSWGLENYGYLLQAPEVRAASINNAWWLVGLTGGSLVLGVLVATLANAVKWENIAKSVIVMPVAISTVAGAIIWRFMYDYRPPGYPQTGILNAVQADLLDREPVAWLIDQPGNKAALLAVGVWMSTGIATVILSAALKSLPPELTEAARMDGAGAWATFRYITLPHLVPSIITVATLLGITALKAFDVVYVMTNGNYETDVLANLMYRQLFLGGEPGHAAGVAVLIVVLTLPIIGANLWAYRKERA